MNSIKHYLSFFMVVVIMGIIMSCGSRQNKMSSEGTESFASTEIDALLANFEDFVDKPIQLEGVCTHICQHGGTKIFLMGSDETKVIRIEAGEVIGSFVPETVNSIVRVNGICKEERIDEAYLLTMEQGEGSHDHAAHQTAEGEVCETEQMANNDYYIECVDYTIVVDEG